MPRKYVDFSYVEVEGTELQDVISLEVEDEATGAEALHTMNRSRRALGSTDGRRDISGTLDSRIGKPREYDWHALLRTGESVLVGYEESDAGERWLLRDLRVTSISRAYSQDGEALDRVSWFALDHTPQ